METLHRRSAAFESAVKQLVAEIKEEIMKKFGNVERRKKDVLRNISEDKLDIKLRRRRRRRSLAMLRAGRKMC